MNQEVFDKSMERIVYLSLFSKEAKAIPAAHDMKIDEEVPMKKVFEEKRRKKAKVQKVTNEKKRVEQVAIQEPGSDKMRDDWKNLKAIQEEPEKDVKNRAEWQAEEKKKHNEDTRKNADAKDRMEWDFFDEEDISKIKDAWEVIEKSEFHEQDGMGDSLKHFIFWTTKRLEDSNMRY